MPTMPAKKPGCHSSQKKTVEICHGVLRTAIQAYNCAEEIRKKAITLALSNSHHSFMAEFAKPYCRRLSEKSLEVVVGHSVIA